MTSLHARLSLRVRATSPLFFLCPTSQCLHLGRLATVQHQTAVPTHSRRTFCLKWERSETSTHTGTVHYVPAGEVGYGTDNRVMMAHSLFRTQPLCQATPKLWLHSQNILYLCRVYVHRDSLFNLIRSTVKTQDSFGVRPDKTGLFTASSKQLTGEWQICNIWLHYRDEEKYNLHFSMSRSLCWRYQAAFFPPHHNETGWSNILLLNMS